MITDERRQRQQAWDRAMADPELRGAFEDVQQAVKDGQLTLAQVGGFTASEMRAALLASFRLVQLGRLSEALQMGGLLVLMSPWEAEHYHLVGLCFHHLGRYEQACHYYRIALVIDDDPVVRASLGEALLFASNDRTAAREALEHALTDLDSSHPRHQPYRQRATSLLETYFTKESA